jgi:hypothetical protein
MPSTYSPLKIELPATGEQSGTWGNTTNTNLGTALEEAITGSANVTFASGNVVLTLTDTNASQVARNLRLNLIGVTGGSTRTLTVPAIKKLYLVSNNCADSVIVGNSTGATVTVPAGNNIFIYNDGTDVLNAITYITALNAASVSAGSVTTTQVDIVSQGDLRLQDTTGGQFVALQAPGTIATSYTLTLPVDDGTTGQVLTTDGSGVLSWTTDAGGDVVGPASATDNAIARFDLTSGKIIQNSVVTIADATGNMAGVGTLSSGAITTTGVLTVPAGTVSAPAITTTGDTNTGIYFPAADTIAFTEGGAEAMRINSSGNVGIGTTTPVAITNYTTLDIRGSNGGLLYIGASGVDSLRLIGEGTDSYVDNLTATGSLVFRTNNATERMRITSAGNVGIGTSSPGSTLDVRAVTGVTQLTSTTGTNSVYSTWSNTGGALYYGRDSSTGGTFGSSAYAAVLYSTGAYPMAFFTNATERMRIDSSGNVGIGTTSPIGTGANRTVLTINGTSSVISNIAIGGTQTFYQYTDATVTQLITKTAIPLALGTNDQERMRIDSSGNVGIGTSSPLSFTNQTSVTVNATSFARYDLLIGGTHTARMTAGAANTSLGTVTATPLVLVTTDAERMRIDSSGNVGIGTSSPTGRFTVVAAASQEYGVLDAPTSGYAFLRLRFNGSSYGNIGQGNAVVTGGANTDFGLNATTNMLFATNGTTERMRINSNGEVGIGGQLAGSLLHVQGNSGATIISVGDSAQTEPLTYMYSDATSDTGNVRTRNNFPLVFGTNNTERMRIDSSGNVGIGTSSPETKLTITNITASAIPLVIKGGTASLSPLPQYTGLAFGYGSATGYQKAGVLFEFTDANGLGNLHFATNNVADSSNLSLSDVRMTITRAGNVGIGTTSPADKLNISAGNIGLTGTTSTINFRNGPGSIIQQIQYSDADGSLNFGGTSGGSFPLKFSTAGSERMRIDASGNAMIGCTTANNNNSNSMAVNVQNGNMYLNHINGTADGTGYVQFALNGTVIGTITQNGTTAVAYNTSSDYRLKENIAPMQGALDTVAQLKPVTYNWKVDGSSGQGFIAHELQEVVPDCVTGEKDAVNEDGSIKAQGIDTSFLVATLTAAIQEQQKLIENLTTRLNALEGK